MITEHTPDTLRAFEQDIAEAFNRGEIRAPVHLSGGNEEQVIEIFRKVCPEDWVATTWRSHYACLLKGVPPDEVRADILLGKSITLNYPAHRIFSSAIVGGALPIALGVAAAIKRRGGGEKVWAFCGDMASLSGIFHECLRYAWGNGLPIYFVIESNGLSVCTDTLKAWGPGAEGDRPDSRVWAYGYKLPWPHSGAGKRVEF